MADVPAVAAVPSRPPSEQGSVAKPEASSGAEPVVAEQKPSSSGVEIDLTVIQHAIKAVVEPRHGRLPADPYKALIQNILSSEFTEGVLVKDRAPPAADYFPDRSDTLIQQLVSFGDCGGFGLKHLAKLISDAAVRRSSSVMAALQQALGNLKSEVKTKGIETVFIDVASINTCVSEVLSQPLHHRYEVAVEAIVTNVKVPLKEGEIPSEADGPKGASFDECIMAFVRRIMEEAFQAEQSEDIICAEITAVMGSNTNNVQRIDVRNMRERRQQVLSILKAATVGEGTISMEIFLKVKHNMINFNKDSKGHTTHTGTNVLEETTGYMRVVRNYRFSYCDNNSDFKRCFSKFPFESLARGVFFDGGHAKIYRDVYAKHLAKMNQTQADRAAELNQRDFFDSRDKVMDDKLFTGVYFMMIKAIRQALGNGEYVYAAEWVMQLNTLMNPTKMNVTFIMARISQICSSDVGKVRAVRDALLSLTSVSEIVRQRIVDYVSKNPEAAARANPRARQEQQSVKPPSKELLAIRTHYEAISKGIVEIRVLLLALLRNVNYSDFRYVSQGLAVELWELFHDDRRTPLATLTMTEEDEEFAMSPRAHGTHLGEERLLEMSGILSKLDTVYKKLECRLQILESSMGLSCLLNLIQIDRKAAEARGALEFKRLDEEKAKEKAKFFIKSNFDEEEWNKRDIRFAMHPWNETPRTVWEMFGYVEAYYRIKMNLLSEGISANARSADMKINWYLDLDVSNGRVGTFTYREGHRAKDVDSLIKYVLFDPWTVEHGNRGKDVLQKDKHRVATNADGTKRTLGLWDAESILRCAPGEFVLADMVADEQGRFETPAFLAQESARIRYLTETHVLRALHEGVYTAITSKDVGSDLLPFYSSVSQSLFHFSAYLHLWNNLKSSEIAQYVFAAARTKGGIAYVEECCGCSVVYTNFRPVPGKLLKYVSGGIFAPNRLLTGLGYKVQDIFVQAYSLPALFNNLPASPSGMTLQTFCGLTFGTALHWGMPNHLSAIDEGKEEAYTEAIRSEADHAAGNRLLLSQLLANKEALKYVKNTTVVGLDYPPTPVEIEVVLRYNCEFLAAEPRARKSFGAEVSKSIHFLASGTDWRVTSVAVAHAAGQTTYDEDGLYNPKRLVFTRKQIIEDRDYDTSMQIAAGKFGFVSVDCAVAIPEPKQPPKDGPAAAGRASSVITMALLAQAFEKVIQRFDLEGKEGYDPCANDRQRACASDNSVNSILQEHMKKKGHARAFVPCRINFTFLSSTPVNIAKKKQDLQQKAQQDSDSDASSMDSRREATRARKQAELEAIRKREEKLGSLSTGNEHLARLVASTVWLSPSAAKGIWGCVQKPGEVQRCYDIEYKLRMRARDILRSRNLCVDAIAHHKLACALSTKYENLVHCTRMNTALAVSFQKTFLMLKMCRSILQDRETTTLDVSAFRITLVKYVCLGLRLGLLSPQCVHLRSGCHQILDLILQLEGLLKLVPLPVKITKPTIVLADGAKEKFRIPGAVTTDQEASWDENELRKVLGQPTTVQQASTLLVNIERKCAVLLEALARDVDTLLFQFTYERNYDPQSYQLLDSRDVVNRNEEKMKKIFRTTLVAHDLIQEKSMFDRAGNIKFEDQSAIKPYYKFQDTVSSLGDTFGATEQKVNFDDDGNEVSEQLVTHTQRVNDLLNESRGMECVLGDLNALPKYRQEWVEREREFAFTETGRLLAEKAAEASAAIDAAAVRGHARENIGKRGSGGRGLSYAIDEEDEDVQDDDQDLARANAVLNAEDAGGTVGSGSLSRAPSTPTIQRPAVEEIKLSRSASRVPSTSSLKSQLSEIPGDGMVTPMAATGPSSVVNKLRMSVGKVKMSNFMEKIKAGATAA